MSEIPNNLTGKGSLASSAKPTTISYNLRIAAGPRPGWYPGTIQAGNGDTLDSLLVAATPTILLLDNGKQVEISFSSFHPGDDIDVLWRPYQSRQ